MAESDDGPPQDVPPEVLEYLRTEEGKRALSEELRRRALKAQPRFREAVWEDARIYSGMLMQAPRFDTKLGFLAEVVRLSWSSDAFLCMLLYRTRTALRVRKVPLLPQVLHRLCMVLGQMDIGDYVVIEPGVYIMHGQVVIDGLVRIGTQTAIAPWVTLGRRGAPLEGPTVQKGVMIGTGAKLLGPIKVGFRSSVGANAVVIEDVPPCTSVAGVPAKIVADRRETDVEFQIIREAMRAKQAQARGNGEGNGGGGGSEPH